MSAGCLREDFRHFTSLGCLFLLFFSFEVLAASGITYQGRLLDPSGVPVTSSNVQFKMQIRSPGAEDCLLYEELQTKDLSATSGVFAVSLKDGTGTRTDSNSWSLFDALSNRQTFSFSVSDCNGPNTYAPSATDNRIFRVFFDLGSGWESMPAQVMNYIPMSIETYAVGGFPASSLFRVEDAGVVGSVAALTTTQYNNLVDLADGSSSTYEKSGSLNGSTLPSIGSGESVRWNGTSWESYSPLASGDETDPTVQAFAKTSLPTCNTGEVLKSDGSVLSCVTDTSGTLPDVGTAGTYTKVTTDAKGRVTSGSALLEVDLPSITTAGKVSGDAITSGEISGSTSIDTSGNITTTGNITATGDGSTSGVIYGAALQTRRLHVYDDDTNFVTLKTPADLSGNYALTLPVDEGTSGQVLSTDGSGTLSWISPSTGSVTSVTGTSPITITGTASAPVVTLDDSGVGAATYGSATQVPVFEVDEKGLIQSVTNTTISGVSPVGSTLSTGKAWLGDGTGKAAENYINVSDLKKSDGTNQIPTTCSDSQTLTWSSLTDVFTCTDISIEVAQISDFPTLGTAAAKDFGAGAGNLVELDSGGKIPSSLLPSSTSTQWTTTGSDIYYDAGSVGIGTDAPAYLLDLRNSTNVSQLHISGTGGEDGGYITAYQGQDLYINMNSAFNGTNWIAKGTNASIISQENGLFNFYSNSGLTVGSTYTPTERMRISATGEMRLAEKLVAGESTVGSLPTFGTISAYTLDGGTGLERGINSIQISSNSNASAFIGRKARGVPLASTTVEDGDYITMLAASPFDGTDFLAPAMVAFVTNGTVATGSIPTDFVVHTGVTGINGGTERLRVTSSGKVGIGTDDPSVELEVAGTIKATGFEGPLTSTSTSLGDGSAASPSMTFSSDPDTGFYSSGADTIGISVGGNKTWDITASGIVSPTTGGALISSANGTAANPTFSFSGDSDTGWFRPAADTLAASTGALERMRIDSSGNVGIGTTTPGALLELQGPATGNGLLIKAGEDDGVDYIMKLQDQDASMTAMVVDTTGAVSVLQDLDASLASGGSLIVGDIAGLNLAIDGNEIMARDNGGASPLYLQNAGGSTIVGGQTNVLYDDGVSSGAHTLFRAYRQGGSAFGIGLGYIANGTAESAAMIRPVGASPDLVFANDSGTERVRITSGGNVGIGTASPTAKLHLYGGSTSTAIPLIQFNISDGVAGAAPVGSIGYGYDSDGSGGIASMEFRNTDSSAGGGGYNFINADGSTVDFRIGFSGNVGIGTTAPTSKLEVSGENISKSRIYTTLYEETTNAPGLIGRKARGTASAPTPVLAGDYLSALGGRGYHSGGAFGTSTVGAFMVTAAEDFTSTAQGTDLVFHTAALGTATATEKMRITSEGNVGIGSSDPDLGLNYTNGSRVLGVVGDGSAFPEATGLLLLGNQRATPTAGDYIGVIDFISKGNGSGQSQLGARIAARNEGAGGTNGMGGVLTFLTKNDDALNFTEKMRIASSGNVGIGTTNPSAKLDVDGTVNADAYTVAGQPLSKTFYIRSSTAAVKCINVNYAPTGYTDDECHWQWNAYAYYEGTTQDTFNVYSDSSCTTLYSTRGMSEVHYQDQINFVKYIKIPINTGYYSILQCIKGNQGELISY